MNEKKNYIIIWKDECDWDMWKDYCCACGCSRDCDAIKIYFGDKDCEGIEHGA